MLKKFNQGGSEDHRVCTDKAQRLAFAIIVSCGLAATAHAQVKITIDHNSGLAATADFKFQRVPSPAREDAASRSRITMIDGDADPNGADLAALTDGILPANEDEPEKNFFFNAGTGGGRLLIDLGSVIEVAQVNTYSWHSSSRAPQVYRLWASAGTDPRFNARPRANIDPATCGWKLITVVDTRSTETDDGGQFGVSITDARGSLGKYHYLLFDCYVTETADDFGNTFYSEVDVVAKK